MQIKRIVNTSKKKDCSTTSALSFAMASCRLQTARKMPVINVTLQDSELRALLNELTSTSMCYLYNLLESHLHILHRDESRPTKLHIVSENKTRYLKSTVHKARQQFE